MNRIQLITLIIASVLLGVAGVAFGVEIGRSIPSQHTASGTANLTDYFSLSCQQLKDLANRELQFGLEHESYFVGLTESFSSPYSKQINGIMLLQVYQIKGCTP